jgi:hypothetical protein
VDHLALVSVVAGAVMIVARGPMIVAPSVTVNAYRWLLGSHARIRAMGVFIAPLGLAMVLSSQGADQGAAWFISILGWLFLLATVFLLIFASFYQKLALGVMDAVDDPVVLRFLGAIGGLFGAFLIYLGIGVF